MIQYEDGFHNYPKKIKYEINKKIQIISIV
jgi:hypothetical protein